MNNKKCILEFKQLIEDISEEKYQYYSYDYDNDLCSIILIIENISTLNIEELEEFLLLYSKFIELTYDSGCPLLITKTKFEAFLFQRYPKNIDFKNWI